MKITEKKLDKWLDILNEVYPCLEEFVEMHPYEIKTLNLLDKLIDEIFDLKKGGKNEQNDGWRTKKEIGKI